MKRASVKNPVITAILEGLYRFKTKKQAETLLQKLKDNFERSNKLPKSEDTGSFKLWIKGFDVSAEEKNKGFAGNYAEIKIIEIEGSFSLTARKLDIAIKYHPERSYENQGFANFGHYILRKIKKGNIYETVTQAQEDLQKIHKDFPTTTIPNKGRLLAMIYSGKGNIKKYILEIKPDGTGKYKIIITENKKPPKAKSGSPKAPNNKKSVGYYTAMVESKKKPKK